MKPPVSFRSGWLVLGLALFPDAATAQAPAPIIPSDTSPAARKEAMTQQLSKMAEAQGNHFARHKKYAANMAPAGNSRQLNFIVRVTNASATGWSAVAISTADTSLRCGIYEGNSPSPNPAVRQPKTPGCWGGAP